MDDWKVRTLDQRWFLRMSETNDGRRTLGRLGEDAWGHVLFENGYRYSRLSDLKGGPPMMKGEDSLILPDFDAKVASHEGRHSIYVDSKVKSGPVLYRTLNEWRQGIDRKNYEHYMACGFFSRQSCAIGLIECFDNERTKDTWRGALLFQTLKQLGRGIPGTGSQEHMIFWPRARFVQLVEMPAADLGELARGSFVPQIDFKSIVSEAVQKDAKKVSQGILW